MPLPLTFTQLLYMQWSRDGLGNKLETGSSTPCSGLLLSVDHCPNSHSLSLEISEAVSQTNKNCPISLTVRPWSRLPVLCVECSSNIPGVLSPLFIYTDCQHAKSLDRKVIKSYIGNIGRKTLHGTQSVIKVPTLMLKGKTYRVSGVFPVN